MNFVSMLKGFAPFALGFLLGSMLFKKEVLWSIIIAYFVVILIFNIVFNKLGAVKKEIDAKSIVDNTKGYVAEGHFIGANLFDKYFSMFSSYLGVLLLFGVGYLFFKKLYVFGFQSLFAVFVFIVLVQIWRTLKCLEKPENL